MARGDTTAQTAESGAATNANALYSTLAPQLQTEAANPQGFGPTVKAEMNTAGQQSAGGGEAAAVGQGALNAGRTRNAGSADAAIADAARTGGQHAVNASLETELADAETKQHQQQAGLAGEENLNATELGQVAPLSNANSNAVGQSWDWAKYILDPALTAAGSAAGGGAFGGGKGGGG